MIKVNRTAKPQSLLNHASSWTQDYLDALDAELANPTTENKKRRKTAEGKYAQVDVKNALKSMFHRKCAFCERKRDYPHIEHFYPKTTYPEKCIEWENLLYACETCNGPAYKGTKFPLTAAGDPLFVNPCDDDPDEHIEFIFEPDDAHPDGFITLVREKTEKGKTTIKELGLNRLNLIEERNEFLTPYYLKLAEMAGNGDEKSKRLLQKAGESASTFAAFARSLYRQYVGG